MRYNTNNSLERTIKHSKELIHPKKEMTSEIPII
jgi:hypothetical protein